MTTASSLSAERTHLTLAETVADGRVSRTLHRLRAGVADRRGWQAGVAVGVVRAGHRDVEALVGRRSRDGIALLANAP